MRYFRPTFCSPTPDWAHKLLLTLCLVMSAMLPAIAQSSYQITITGGSHETEYSGAVNGGGFFMGTSPGGSYGDDPLSGIDDYSSATLPFTSSYSESDGVGADISNVTIDTGHMSASITGPTLTTPGSMYITLRFHLQGAAGVGPTTIYNDGSVAGAGAIIDIYDADDNVAGSLTIEDDGVTHYGTVDVTYPIVMTNTGSGSQGTLTFSAQAYSSTHTWIPEDGWDRTLVASSQCEISSVEVIGLSNQ